MSEEEHETIFQEYLHAQKETLKQIDALFETVKQPELDLGIPINQKEYQNTKLYRSFKIRVLQKITNIYIEQIQPKPQPKPLN